MKRFGPIAILLCVSILGAACSGGGSDGLETRAQGVVRDLFGGRYADVRAGFDGVMLAALSEQGLAEARLKFEDRFGRFISMGDPEAIDRGDLTVIDIPLHMAHGDGQARVTYEKDGKVAGLYLLRTGVPVPY